MDLRRVDRFCEEEDPKVFGINEVTYIENLLEQTTFTDSKVNLHSVVNNLRSLQIHEFSLPTNYRIVWETAKKIFQERREQGNFSADYHNEIPDECHIALIAYTLKDPGIYSDFNKRTRDISKTNSQQYPYRSFYQLLKLAVENVNRQKSPLLSQQEVLYRGINFEMETPYAIGDTIQFQHFVSTTRSFEVAKSFGNVLFVLHNVREEISLPMDDHSYSPCEQEVLMCPNEQYTIFKYEIIDGRHTFHMHPKLA